MSRLGDRLDGPHALRDPAMLAQDPDRVSAVGEPEDGHAPATRVDADDMQGGLVGLGMWGHTVDLALLYSASARETTSGQDWEGGVVAWRAIVSRSRLSLTSRASALASASSSAARRPSTPCCTKSATPVPERARTGSPAVRASRAAMPKASSRAGVR